MRRADHKITYSDPGRVPAEHHTFVCGGDIYIALIAHIGYLDQQNLAPSPDASFLISNEDLVDLLDIYYGDSRFMALTVDMEGSEASRFKGVPKISGVRIKTPSPKPPGW